MLNISDNSIKDVISTEDYHAFNIILNPQVARSLVFWIAGFLVMFVVILFMPWTQNIQATGKVTTLRPQQRPQTIESTIAGRIDQWFVNEGDTVEKGDTIVHLTEIKDKYFDPQLIDRTAQQIVAKRASINSYKLKADALNQQQSALMKAMVLKIEEARNKLDQAYYKLQADSIELRAAEVSDSIAVLQLRRWQQLFSQDLKSRTDLEKMRKERQQAQAKLIAQENKLASSRAAWINAQISLDNVENEYLEKLNKAESDRQSAMSDRFDTEAQVVKMENELTNLEMREGYRYILAPQRGIVNQALKSGVGETVKEGDPVLTILPVDMELAAEIFVSPVDMPLVRKGEHVRLEFDGWPSLIFGSGWPQATFGTFGGSVFAIENNISENGKYRVLIRVADPAKEPWPEMLSIGGGVRAFALLNEVPVWYELWRKLNGFPPDFYTGKQDENTLAKSAAKK